MTSFVNDFHSVIKIIKNLALSQKNFEKALIWGEVYGKILYTNHCGIFQDDELEVYLTDLYLERNNKPLKNRMPGSELHLLSELYSTGGHSRLFEKVISARNTGDVLITRGCEKVDEIAKIPSFSKVFTNKNDYDFEQLISIASSYETIIMHIHPNDLIAAVLVGVLKKINGCRVIFINHADHVFSFGFYSADIVAEVSLYGMDLSNKYRNVRSSFLGIPLGLLDFSLVRSADNRAQVHLVSGGTGFKYKPYDNISFPEFVIGVLKRFPSVTFTVIGPDLVKETWWWKAKFLYWNRLRVVKKIPHEQYKKEVNCADLYVDSFPMTGGTALPEVRASGVPVTGLMCGSSGYTPLDITKYESKGGLYSAINEFISMRDTSKILEVNNSNTLKKLYLYVHGPDSFSERLHGVLREGTLYSSYDESAKFDPLFYHHQWKKNKNILVGKAAYQVFVDDWKAGGREVAWAVIKVQPIKYALKILFSFVKKAM